MAGALKIKQEVYPVDGQDDGEGLLPAEQRVISQAFSNFGKNEARRCDPLCFIGLCGSVILGAYCSIMKGRLYLSGTRTMLSAEKLQ